MPQKVSPTARIASGHDEAAVREAARFLAGGSLVVIPTDTVYGLACHPDAKGVLDRIYRVKRRETGRPIPLLAASLSVVEARGVVLDVSARRLAARFWPGPLTMVLGTREGNEGFRV